MRGFRSPGGVSTPQAVVSTLQAVLRMEFCCAKLRRYAWLIVGYNPPEFALCAKLRKQLPQRGNYSVAVPRYPVAVPRCREAVPTGSDWTPSHKLWSFAQSAKTPEQLPQRGNCSASNPSHKLWSFAQRAKLPKQLPRRGNCSASRFFALCAKGAEISEQVS
jgi:hypothetical protein